MGHGQMRIPKPDLQALGGIRPQGGAYNAASKDRFLAASAASLCRECEDFELTTLGLPQIGFGSAVRSCEVSS